MSEAKANKRKGIAELRQPTTNKGIKFRRISASRFNLIDSINKAKPANKTRNSISQTGPKIGAAIRMKRKEAPQTAANNNNSSKSDIFIDK
ncbi:hypothetical protein H1P_3280006 [Hyella patelloides LEGE 07179]|uniref:Uncharacterized protein n=1 Tax=Hyella patelloides LEGE 07179 TaxID=945734 RepID=A0A563VV36_9CYAN|nr:hypothetical protein H1P_3280006 [Hyella patelloides LEGE 07179]